MPTTTLDGFARADGPIHAGDGATLWTPNTFSGGAGGLFVVGNRAGATGGASSQMSLFTIGPDFRVAFQVTAYSTSYLQIMAVLENPGSSGWGGFWLVAGSGGGSDNWVIERRIGGVVSGIASASPGLLTANEWVMFERSGTTFRGWRSSLATPALNVDSDWTQIVQATGQSDLMNAGRLDLELGNAATRVGPIYSFAAAAGPVNVSPPTLSGDPREGLQLTYEAGAWSGTPTPAVSAVLEVSADGTSGWASVGAVDPDDTYSLGSGDVGKFFRVTESATNTEGTASQASSVVGPVLEPLPGLTFYVDADHPDRSEGWSRVQAGDDPDSPFESPQAAALVAEPGDVIEIKPSTLGQADPGGVDPDVYPEIHHLRANDGSDVIPHADCSGVQPITVTAYGAKWLGVNARGMKNWTVKGHQQGYDRGSGDDRLTNGILHACADMTFEDVHFTGGGYYCLGCTGTMLWKGCETNAEYVGGTGNFLDGNGFVLRAIDTSDGIWRDVTYRFEDCVFDGIYGEDALQCSGIVTAGVFEVVGCEFRNITQSAVPGAPHTDCVQSLGGKRYLIDRCRFFEVSSPYIASDGENALAVITNNLVDGVGNGFHGQGTREWIIAGNTIITPGQSVAIGDRFNNEFPDFEQRVTMINNVAGDLDIASGAVLAADSLIDGNVLYRQPGLVTDWGVQVDGLPEFGSSARLASAGLDGNYELANAPSDSAGIGDGVVVTVDVIADADVRAGLASDHLGRERSSPPDSGAFQSDPGTPVSATARPPYVVEQFPAPNATGVARDVSVSFRLVPVPGQEVEPGSVSAASVYVADSTSSIPIPAAVELGALDGDGRQLVTVDMLAALPSTEGELFPLVLYTVRLDGVQDTQGSAVPLTSWSFRAAGTGAPAIGVPGGEAPISGEFTVEVAPWPVGTLVEVFPGSALPASAAAPSGPAMTSGTVGADQAVSFSGLPEGVRLVAFASGVAVRFMVPSPVFRTVRVQ